jgi:hypothetical protein
MKISPSELDQKWSALPAPQSEPLVGTRISELPPDDPVYIAIDRSGRRQLLLGVAPESKPLKLTGARGLDVATEVLRVGDSKERPYICLVCLNSADYGTFAAFCADIISAIRSGAGDYYSIAAHCLGRWRSFWATGSEGLTAERALGLFGELWFLYRWMPPITASRLERWQGPNGARHDFQWPQSSVEIKATAVASGCPPIHRISNLDQLADPEAGRLYLFSLQVADDSLAANSLSSLAQLLSKAAGEIPGAGDILNEKLAQYGYNPAHAGRYSRRLRIVAEELYSIEGNFPRITRSSIASCLRPGIESVSYGLNMVACRPWRIATDPSDAAARFLRD